MIECELLKLVKVEDWLRDGKTFKRTLRKGKGRQVNLES